MKRRIVKFVGPVLFVLVCLSAWHKPAKDVVVFDDEPLQIIPADFSGGRKDGMRIRNQDWTFDRKAVDHD